MRTLLLLAFLLLSACASSNHADSANAAPANPRVVTIFHSDGRSATWDELVAASSATEVVIIGENHGHPLGLASASALWTDVLARSPNGALSLEFFERDEQSRLDDYLTGVVNEETFRKRTSRTDGNYPPGHRDMVESAKTAKRPVAASNAPRQYVRIARTEGYDRLKTLTPEQRRLYRIPEEIPTGRYHDDFVKMMGPMTGHGAPEKPKAQPDAPPPDPAAEEAKRKADVEAMFRSQSLWDWTMSESIATFLTSGSVPVVHVVGRFHCDFDGGLVQALRHQRAGVRTLVVSYVQKDGPQIESEDIGRADFIVYVGAESKVETAANR